MKTIKKIYQKKNLLKLYLTFNFEILYCHI